VSRTTRVCLWGVWRGRRVGWFGAHSRRPPFHPSHQQRSYRSRPTRTTARRHSPTQPRIQQPTDRPTDRPTNSSSQSVLTIYRSTRLHASDTYTLSCDFSDLHFFLPSRRYQQQLLPLTIYLKSFSVSVYSRANTLAIHL
jgi:hypothetical protein